MLTTKRKPASVGEILVEEFMEPMGLTQGALAEAMGVQRKHVNELCNNRRNVTAPTALILARVFGNLSALRAILSGCPDEGIRENWLIPSVERLVSTGCSPPVRVRRFWLRSPRRSPVRHRRQGSAA